MYPVLDFNIETTQRVTSWFKTKYYKTNNLRAFQTPTIVIKDDPVIKTVKIRLYPSSDQMKLFKEWIEILRLVYNHSVDIQEKLTTKILDMKKFRQLYKAKIINLIGDKRVTASKIYSHAIDSVFHRLCTAYKSAFSNKTAGNITHFRMRHIKRNKPNQSFTLELQNFSRKHVCVIGKVIGRIRANKTFISSKNTTTSVDYTISNEVQVVKNANGEYYLHIIDDNAHKLELTGRKAECAIDPGLRTFCTLYDKELCAKIGNDVGDRIRLLKDKIDKTNHRSKNDPKIKRYHKRIYDKITHLVNDLHWKVILLLVNRYNIINIGDLSTKSCIAKLPINIKQTQRKKRGLPKRCKDPLSLLRHYVFRERLKYKATQYNCTINVINESYTSQGCGKCCINHKTLGGDKIFKCPQPGCTFTWDRDFNGARNIMKKAHGSFNPINPPTIIV